MTRRILTPEEIDEIRQLRLDGVSLPDVAARFGIHQTSVSRHTRDLHEDEKRLSPVELLEAAYPWSVWLPIAGREEFARQLRNMPHWSKEADIDRLVWRWQGKANDLRRAS